jgi:hypothetical protein
MPKRGRPRKGAKEFTQFAAHHLDVLNRMADEIFNNMLWNMMLSNARIYQSGKARQAKKGR